MSSVSRTLSPLETLVAGNHGRSFSGRASDAPRVGLAWSRRYRMLLSASDAAVIILAVTVALFARFGLGDAELSVAGVSVQYQVVALMVAILWFVTIGAFRTRATRMLGVGFAEYRSVVNASLFIFGLLAIAFLVFQVQIARGFFIIALPIGLAALLLERWIWRRWLNHMRNDGHYLSRAIVVGSPAEVAYVVKQIEKKSGAAYSIVGMALPEGDQMSLSFAGETVPVVSSLDKVADAARMHGADAVIVAGESSGSGTFIRDLGWALEGSGSELVVASGLTNVAGPRIHFRPVEGLPLMHVELPQFEGGKHVAKRLFDIAVSAAALIFLAPFFAIIAVAIRRDSEGGVFFRQERVGRNGETFHMVKFRSMVQTAEADLQGLLDQNEGSGPLFKLKHDPRITRLGAMLRKFSIDELPQFWNVLMGHMSLVGPRPPLESEVKDYEKHVHRRLYIKPGLTGMWQVNGRSDLSWEESVRLDLYYVENWSLTGDLIILWRTFKVVTNPVGAY